MAQPFFSSRKWIKLWINEWRDGTLRWQATDAQRAFWVDLLTLAGRSRYPGIVCAGRDGPNEENIVGYPIQFLSPNSSIKTEEEAKEILDLFASRKMLSYTVSKSANGDKLFAVTISNWKQYQSDYEANRKYQQTYRAKKRKASSSSPNRLTSQLGARKSLEVELEVEKEGEEEVRRAPRATSTPAPPDERLNVESVKAQIEGRREVYHERETAGQRRLRRNKEAADSVV